jgi:hypothetical protein
MLEAKHASIAIKERENYGSSLHPSYTIAVGIEIGVNERPDALHQIFTQTALISRDTIPFEPVSNFRGSTDNKPYYSAIILHDGVVKEYRVLARDTGGFLRTKITYEPMVYPEELRMIHPAEFARSGIEVKEWELANYKHYFMLVITSKRYENFFIRVRRDEGLKLTVITIYLVESALRERTVPCSWYLERLSIFKDLSLEDEVKKKIEEFAD